jgi:hypothetical protein
MSCNFSFWDWFTEICSKIAEVVIDTLSAVWDWIVKFKEYIAFAGVLILGIVLCIFATPLGIAVLSGMALSFVISMALNGWEINKMTFVEAAIGGLLGLIGGGITAGASRGLASGIGQKLIMGAKNSKVLGPVLRGGQKLVSKLPAPLQNMFTKGGVIGAVEGAGTSVADDILHGRKINWKNAVLSGIGGAALVGLGSFIVPKLDPIIDKVTTAFKKSETVEIAAKQVADCFSYRYQSNSYLAFIQVSNCVRTQQLTDEIRQKIKEENFQKYGEESKSRKPYSPHKDTGKITVRENGKRVVTRSDGTQTPIYNSKYAGKDYPITVNGEDYKVPFDENGFPDFTKWTAYTSTLNQDQYLLTDKAQFKLLSKRLYKDMTKDPKLRKDIDNTILETLEKGVGESNYSARNKLEKFISQNSIINNNLTKTEIEDLLAGKGSPSIIEKLNKDPELKQKFLEANISWIEKGNDPVGFTWHHHQDEGKMQLVKTGVHGYVRHTGGRQIWGGGR